MVEMLPSIEVVPDDAFNSSPSDPKLMGPDALQRLRAGEMLPSTRAPTPLVCACPAALEGPRQAHCAALFPERGSPWHWWHLETEPHL